MPFEWDKPSEMPQKKKRWISIDYCRLFATLIGSYPKCPVQMFTIVYIPNCKAWHIHNVYLSITTQLFDLPSKWPGLPSVVLLGGGTWCLRWPGGGGHGVVPMLSRPAWHRHHRAGHWNLVAVSEAKGCNVWSKLIEYDPVWSKKSSICIFYEHLFCTDYNNVSYIDIWYMDVVYTNVQLSWGIKPWTSTGACQMGTGLSAFTRFSSMLCKLHMADLQVWSHEMFVCFGLGLSRALMRFCWCDPISGAGPFGSRRFSSASNMFGAECLIIWTIVLKKTTGPKNGQASLQALSEVLGMVKRYQRKQRMEVPRWIWVPICTDGVPGLRLGAGGQSHVGYASNRASGH